MRTRTQFRVTPARIVFRGSNHPWKDLSSKLSSSLFFPSNRNNSIAINVRARSPKAFYNNLSFLSLPSSLCIPESNK